jgi:hypothetical protein
MYHRYIRPRLGFGFLKQQIPPEQKMLYNGKVKMLFLFNWDKKAKKFMLTDPKSISSSPGKEKKFNEVTSGSRLLRNTVKETEAELSLRRIERFLPRRTSICVQDWSFHDRCQEG